MPRPSLIQVGNRILNLDAVRYIEVDGPEVINVYIYEQDQPLQFLEAEAGALTAILDTGYVGKIAVGPSEEAFKAMISAMDSKP